MAGPSTDQQAQAIAAASKKYGVPSWILLGVYGMESSFGSDHSVSTAGATGPFQFIPSTAKTYNYPLTSNPTPAQFQQQADAAAHYLSDLFHQTGSWDTALQHYSGGGYGQQQVGQKATTAGFNLLQALHSAGGSGITGPGGVAGSIDQAATTTGEAASSVADTATTIANTLGSIQFWIRLGEAIAGVILIALGLKSLTGGTVDPIATAQRFAR